MECKYDIDIKEPDASGKLFQPNVRFRLIQLNMTPDCVIDGEIDYQINELIKHAEKMRKEVKRKFRAAQTRHNKILTVRRKEL